MCIGRLLLERLLLRLQGRSQLGEFRVELPLLLALLLQGGDDLVHAHVLLDQQGARLREDSLYIYMRTACTYACT